MKAMLEGPLKAAATRTLHLDLRAHSEGADAVAQAIVSGSLHADVFIPVTAGPMLTVIHAGKAESAQPIARTELVLIYSPKSRFAPQLEAAASGKANWWEVLQKPGLRIGRGNPAADPGARAILFAMMLAAGKYRQPNLVEKVLGSALNPAQIVPGVQAALQRGELDVSSSYKIGVGNLPYIALPKEINLSSQRVREEHPEVRLRIGEKTFYPEPLVFYAGLVRGAANPVGAAAFLKWLQGVEAQELFRQHQFEAAGDVAELRA